MTDKIVPIEARIELPLALVESISIVEERFVDVPTEKYGSAATEAKAKEEMQKQTSGWWVTLPRLGIVLHVGMTKPDLQAGDVLVLSASRMRRAGEFGAVAPAPSPTPAAAPAAEKIDS